MHRLYYSINYEDYDVGTSEWSRSHTVRSYTSVLSHDRNSRLIYPDKKVFLPESKLRELQTEFGFDDDYTGAKRKRRAQQDDRSQGGIQQTFTAMESHQNPITNFFGPKVTIPVPQTLTMGAMGGASRSTTSAIDANGSVDSDDVYESDAEQVSGYDTSDGD